MIYDIVTGNWSALTFQLNIFLLLCLIVCCAVVIDHIYGTKKSIENQILKDLKDGKKVRPRKEYIHSNGFRRSGKKLTQYLTLMLFAFWFDILNPIWIYTDFPSMPLFSMLCCAVWVWTERKSVFEKFEDKVRDDFEYNSKDLIKTISELRQEMKEITGDLAEIKDNEKRIKNE